MPCSPFTESVSHRSAPHFTQAQSQNPTGCQSCRHRSLTIQGALSGIIGSPVLPFLFSVISPPQLGDALAPVDALALALVRVQECHDLVPLIVRDEQLPVLVSGAADEVPYFVAVVRVPSVHDSPPSVVLHICNGGRSVIVVLPSSPTHRAPCPSALVLRVLHTPSRR